MTLSASAGEHDFVGSVYLVRNIQNGKVYVGQTIRTIDERWKIHIRDARRGSTLYFHSAIRKYGAESFSIERLQICRSLEQLNKAEKKFIEKNESCNPRFGYNHRTGGENSMPTLSARQRMSEAHRGKRLSDDHRQQQSEGRKGHSTSAETRSKISLALRGHGCSVATRNRISASNTGRPLSEGHKKKLSKLGIGHEVSEETRRKLSVVLTGRKRSAEHGQHLSEALRGRKLSVEHRQRISDALRNRKANATNGDANGLQL